MGPISQARKPGRTALVSTSLLVIAEAIDPDSITHELTRGNITRRRRN